MPANLTPEYEKADLRYRQAKTDSERIQALEEMLAAIPKHKGTEKMQADLKRRLSQMRKAAPKASHSKGPDPFHVPKSGAGQAVIIGPPNTGKSSLVVATTHAEAKVADYPFTTAVPLPGMWQHEDMQIELVDTPPLSPERFPPGLLGTIRCADVVGIMVEATETGLEQVEMVLGILKSNGVRVSSAPQMQRELRAAGLHPGLVIANKVECSSPSLIETLQNLYSEQKEGFLEVVGISVSLRQGLEELFLRLWRLLARVRVYTKAPGKAPDLVKPFVLPSGATVEDLARQIHRDLPERMKFARLWGHSRFEGQQVHKTEILQDRDVVEIHE